MGNGPKKMANQLRLAIFVYAADSLASIAEFNLANYSI